MIYDTFMICHELDLLEVRLRILYDYVDKFVILECDTTHAGNPKPLYFDENKSRFDWAKDKIIHLIGRPPYNVKSANEFGMENCQRQMLFDQTLALGEPDDIMLISDVDEIPSREVIEKIQELEVPTALHQDFYYYNVNCPRSRKWMGTMALRLKHEFGSIETMRGKRYEMAAITKDCGWHFSYFMTIDQIREKLASFSHFDQLSRPPFTDEAHIMECIRNNRTFLNKQEKDTKDVAPIPDYVLNEMKNFPVFMGNYE